MTAPRFELKSQRQKIPRLPTEPPGGHVDTIRRSNRLLLLVLITSQATITSSSAVVSSIVDKIKIYVFSSAAESLRT